MDNTSPRSSHARQPILLLPAVILFFTCLSAACGGSMPTSSQGITVTPTLSLAAPILLPTDEGAVSSVPTATQAPDYSTYCSSFSVTPTPGPTEPSIYAPVSTSDWSIGPEDASVTILVYSDFQCPYCAQFGLVSEQLEEEFPDDLRLVYRYFPLNQHDKALLAAQAAEAAGLQGKFWEMHDLLFRNQDTWAGVVTPVTTAQFTEWLVEQAPSIGLDTSQFSQDLTSQAVVERVAEAKAEAIDTGIPGTPFVLVNGEYWSGPYDINNLRNMIRTNILADRQVTGCPPMTIDVDKQYLATLKTEKGDIVIQLYPDKAPYTVNSFIFLAQNGWYNDVTFYKVISDPDIAQTGDPSGTGWGTPGYTFIDEISSDLSFDKAGVVAMANMGPDTNGSLFFITKGSIPSLNGEYTIFGQVIEGMDVVKQLTPRDPDHLTSDGSTEEIPDGDKILEVTILEK